MDASAAAVRVSYLQPKLYRRNWNAAVNWRFEFVANDVWAVTRHQQNETT